MADVTGDHEAAPDVTDVRVTNTASGTISFAVSTPSHGALTPSTWVELDVDIDRRHSTGGGGVEAFVALSEGKVFVGRWSASEQDFVVRTTGARARSAGGVVTFVVPRVLRRRHQLRLLRRQRRLRPGRRGQRDRPRAERRSLVALHAREQASAAPDRGRRARVPARPRSGRAFSVVVPVRRSDTARGITSGSATCTVRVAGRPVRAAGKVAAGTGRCSLRVPAGASGAALRGSIVVRSAGKSVTTRFSFPVR